jgi:CDC45-like protein
MDKNNKALVEIGIEMAKELQKAMVHIGTAVIDKKEVKMGGGFRYVMLENDQLRDVQLFQYPLALQKLALFIMEIHKVSAI